MDGWPVPLLVRLGCRRRRSRLERLTAIASGESFVALGHFANGRSSCQAELLHATERRSSSLLPCHMMLSPVGERCGVGIRHAASLS